MDDWSTRDADVLLAYLADDVEYQVCAARLPDDIDEILFVVVDRALCPQTLAGRALLGGPRGGQHPRPGGHTQRLLTVVKARAIQQVRTEPADKVNVWPHLLGIDFGTSYTSAALFAGEFLVIPTTDGDLQMLQYTAGGDGARFMGYVHHDDAEREWAYDRDSHIGGLDKGLDEAAERGWTVVSMKDEWKKIYPGEGLP